MGLLESLAAAAESAKSLASDVSESIRRFVSGPSKPGSFTDPKESAPTPMWGWTMDIAIQHLMAFCDGDLDAGQRLMMAMERDPVFSHGLDTRAETLTQTPFRWQRHPEMSEADFELWVDNWRDCLTVSDHQQLAKWRICLGVGPTCATYAPDPSGRQWLPRLHLKEPANFSWNEQLGRYQFHGLRGEPEDVVSDGERWLLWQRPGRRPHLNGALVPLTVAVFTKQEAIRQWPSRNRSHARPQRLLYFPASQRESSDVKALIERAQSLLAGGVLPLPQYGKDLPSFDFKLLQDDINGTASNTFENLIRLCDEYITLVLQGAIENTQGSSASNAKAKTQDKVTLRKVKADTKSDEQAETTLARTTRRLNDQDPRTAPEPVHEADPPEDEALKAERQERKANGASQLGGFIEKLEGINALRKDRNLPPIEYEADFLGEQCGVLLTRAQDGEQSREL